jgi:hypothetical protein
VQDRRKNHMHDRRPRWKNRAIECAAEPLEAVAAMLPLGSVGDENEVNERGERLIWVEPTVLARLKAMRGPGESFSDVILRIAVEKS